MNRRFLLPALVLLAAALLRTWALGLNPPGFQFDEAHNAIDAARWLDGQRPLFLPDNGGREVLLTWLHAPLLAGLGRDHPVLAMRLVSAFAGLLTVALTGVVIGRVFEDRRVGWFAAAFLALSPWHLHFSRYAIRAILAPLWATGAVGAWWMAVRTERDGGRWRKDRRRGGKRAASGGGETGSDAGTSALRRGARRLAQPWPWWAWAALCGLCLAGAVWSHPSGRLLPLVPLGHVAWRIRGRKRRGTWLPFERWHLQALGVTGLVSFLLFLPLGIHFLSHPWLFTSHASDVSLAAVAERDFGGSLGRAAWAQVVAVAGMFFVAGDPSTIHGLPGLPAYDPLTALFAGLGLALILAAILFGHPTDHGRSMLMLLWLAVGLLPTLFSDRPPNFSRAIAMLPALAALPAMGLRVVAVGAFNERMDRALPAVAYAFAAGWALFHVFHAFPRLPELAESYDQDKVAVVEALAELPTDAERFLAPVWAEQATIDYLVTYARPLLPEGEVWDLNESESWSEEDWAAWADAGDDGAWVSGAGYEEGDTDGRVGEPALRGLDWRDTIVFPAERDVLLGWPAAEAERDDVLPSLDRLLGGLAPWPEIADKVAAGDTVLLPSDDVDRICGEDGRGGGEMRAVESILGSEIIHLPISGQPTGLVSRRGSELTCLLTPDAQGEPRARLLVVGLQRRMLGNLAPPRDAPLEPETFVAARFGGALELVGYTVGAPTPGEALPLTLLWRVIEPPLHDLTTFVHLEAPDGRSLGQVDREPGGGSHPTTRWRSGDIVIERFEPLLDAAAAGEDAIRPVVGWYDRATGERLRVGEKDALPLRTLPLDETGAATAPAP